MKTWKIDKDHSHIGFKVKHMMFSKVAGNFKRYEAVVKMEDGRFETAKIDFEAEASSITTHNEERDQHLKSTDFFSAEKNPTIKFESTNVQKKDDKAYTVDGQLTMNGITKKISLEADYSGVMKDPWGNDRIALVLKTQIDRTDWEITWNQTLESGGVLVSKQVEFEVEAELT